MDNSIFRVNQEPYRIWDVDLAKRNMEFLDYIDTGYFDYVLKVHQEAEDKKRASIALRTTLYHALETMFSLLGAFIQAPDCAYAWIAKCSNTDLRELVGKIEKRDNSLFNRLNLEHISWESVARAVRMAETEKEKQAINLFAILWHRLAPEYLDQNHIEEYKALKHGMRVRSSGFSLRIGVERKYGEPVPDHEMKLIGGSKFGTSFFKIEKIREDKRSRSLRSKRTLINLNIERVTLLLPLVSMSITNITSALKRINGAKPAECPFVCPGDEKDFDKPWQYTTGITSFNVDDEIYEDEVKFETRQELIDKLNETKRN